MCTNEELECALLEEQRATEGLRVRIKEKENQLLKMRMKLVDAQTELTKHAEAVQALCRECDCNLTCPNAYTKGCIRWLPQ